MPHSETEVDEVLDVIGTKMRTAPTDQRVRILEALAQLFTVEVILDLFFVQYLWDKVSCIETVNFHMFL